MIYKGLELHNIQEIIELVRKPMLSRLPHQLHLANGHTRGFQMTGAEIRLVPKTKVVIKIGSINPYIQSKALVEYDGHYDIQEVIINQSSEIVIEPVDVFTGEFKQGVQVRVLLTGEHIYIDDVQGEFDLFQDYRKKYLAYGTSITQGLFTNQSEGAYPTILGRSLNYEVHNYGMSGRAYCEPQTVEFLCSLGQFDLVTLELSVNMYTDGYDIKEYQKRLYNLIKQVSEHNASAKIFCIGLFPFYDDFGLNNPEKLNESSPDDFRKVHKEVVDSFKSDQIIYVDASTLLSKHNLCVDLIHPSSSGMYEIAFNLKNIIEPYIK